MSQPDEELISLANELRITCQELMAIEQRIMRISRVLLRWPNVGLQPGKRGRKGMNPDERKVVSERMKAYWADRKKREDR